MDRIEIEDFYTVVSFSRRKVGQLLWLRLGLELEENSERIRSSFILFSIDTDCLAVLRLFDNTRFLGLVLRKKVNSNIVHDS